MKNILKTILPWVLIAPGLVIIIYSHVAGRLLFPVFNYDNPVTPNYNE